MLSLSAVAFADVFVSSPSTTPTPKIVNYDAGNPEWDGQIVITGYSERETLTPEKEKAIEDAYDQIKGASSVTELNTDLKTIAEDKKVDPKNLLVSDLFDLSYINGSVQDHGVFSITLDIPTTQRFVALMQFIDNEWKIVDNAKVVDGKLTFSTADFTQFAIVVDGKKASPKTSQNDIAMLYVIIAIAAAGAVTVMFKSAKKCGQN